MVILHSKISEVESELRETEEELSPVELERKRTEAKGLREMDDAGADVGWEAASEAQSFQAEVWSLGEPAVLSFSLEDQSAMRRKST